MEYYGYVKNNGLKTLCLYPKMTKHCIHLNKIWAFGVKQFFDLYTRLSCPQCPKSTEIHESFTSTSKTTSLRKVPWALKRFSSHLF